MIKQVLSLFTFLRLQLCSNFTFPFELSWFLSLQNPLSYLPQTVSIHGPSCCVCWFGTVKPLKYMRKAFLSPPPVKYRIQRLEVGLNTVLLSPKLRFLFQIPINVGLAILSLMFPPYQLST